MNTHLLLVALATLLIAGASLIALRLINRRRLKKSHTNDGAAASGERPRVERPQISVFRFGAERFDEIPLKDLKDLPGLRQDGLTLWIDIDGGVPEALVGQLGKLFQLDDLAIEDVIHSKQRTKVEDYTNHQFIVLRMPHACRPLTTEQLSIFLGKGFVITFQEKAGGDCLDPVRRRLRNDKGALRKHGADYLAYAIIDAVVDACAPILDEIGERMLALDKEALQCPSNATPSKIHANKRDLITLRRALWPLRDAIYTFWKDMGSITEDMRKHLRDCYDHATRMLELLATHSEMAESLLALYLSSVNNRLSEATRVLTVIATLCAGPTLIAGIYGMNFKTDVSPWNMPELSWEWGYPFSLLLMALVSGGTLLFLWWRGFLSASWRVTTGNRDDI